MTKLLPAALGVLVAILAEDKRDDPPAELRPSQRPLKDFIGTADLTEDEKATAQTRVAKPRRGPPIYALRRRA